MRLNRFYPTLLATALFFPAISLADANSQIVVDSACQASGDPNCAAGRALFGANGFLTGIINTLIFAIGAISIIMVIIGGLRYVLSGGDSAGVKGAKDTILYALIGLAIAILSFTIVQFVIGRVG